MPGPIVMTYTEDHYFEVLWNRSAHAFTRLVKLEPSVMLGVDFSTWWDWDFPRCLWNHYRSLWCTRYAQDAGIKVWPNLNIPLEHHEAWFAPYPRGVYCCVSMQTNWPERGAYLSAWRTVLETVQPSGLLFYGVPEQRKGYYDVAMELIPKVDVVEPIYVRRRRYRAEKTAAKKAASKEE